jgi:hypothetical protein
MAKLSDMFTQARRTQSGGSMGFLGKNRPEVKPRAAALVVEFPTVDAGNAESAIKAGADGLLFAWDGADSAALATIKQGIEAAKAGNENAISGLHITSGWDTLEHDSLEQLKEQGVNYIILPLSAPARLLAMHVKDLQIVITIPMREGDMYPLFIRNLTAFETIAAVQLDFGFSNGISDLSIEEIIQYRAVRESVRFPALLDIPDDISEADAFTLTTLGIQAVILTAASTSDETAEHIKAVRELLEKVFQEEKEKDKANPLKP